MQEAVWLRQLIFELSNGDMPAGAAVIHGDGWLAVSLAQFCGRGKHMDIQHHFVCKKVGDGTIELKYCRTDATVADMLTKGLGSLNFEKLIEEDGWYSYPFAVPSSEKECWKCTL